MFRVATIPQIRESRIVNRGYFCDFTKNLPIHESADN